MYFQNKESSQKYIVLEPEHVTEMCLSVTTTLSQGEQSQH